jgi:hypothetical protein
MLNSVLFILSFVIFFGDFFKNKITFFLVNIKPKNLNYRFYNSLGSL